MIRCGQRPTCKPTGQISLPSASRSWPIRIWRSAGRRVPPSTRRIRPRSIPLAKRDIRTTQRWADFGYSPRMTITRRAILGAAASTAAVETTVSFAQPKPPPPRPRPNALKSLAGNAQPITAQELQARLSKVQWLMQEKKIAALLGGAGGAGGGGAGGRGG